jgi:2-polyprenyl-3-methyl-5-hydroxy-6-metoxy-1,4-benzoquinol methylase
MTLTRCWACGDTDVGGEPFPPFSYVRCTSCGLVFDPDRDRRDVHRLYDDRYFDDYETIGPYRSAEAAARLVLVTQYASRGRLLELGPAGGYFLSAAQRAGFEVVGVEPAESIARAARDRFGVDVIAGFAEEVELGQESYDVACAWHVLEHIVEPAKAVEQVRSALRPGGVFALEVPNLGSAAARVHGASWQAFSAEHHVAHYTPRSIQALLGRFGLDILALRTVSWTALRPPGRPRTLLSGLRQIVRSRANPWRPHPWRHDLLQVVARR